VQSTHLNVLQRSTATVLCAYCLTSTSMALAKPGTQGQGLVWTKSISTGPRTLNKATTKSPTELEASVPESSWWGKTPQTHYSQTDNWKTSSAMT